MADPCAQSTYGGCAGTTCERRCFTRVINLPSPANDHIINIGRWYMALAAATVLAGFVLAAAVINLPHVIERVNLANQEQAL